MTGVLVHKKGLLFGRELKTANFSGAGLARLRGKMIMQRCIEG